MEFNKNIFPSRLCPGLKPKRMSFENLTVHHLTHTKTKKKNNRLWETFPNLGLTLEPKV